MKITLLGANGGIGRPLSMLLKLCPSVDKLSLYMRRKNSIDVDLNQINSKCRVDEYSEDEIYESLVDTDITVLLASAPLVPGMNRDDLFDGNASIVSELTESIAKVCPESIVCIITNPINSTVPIACEILKRYNVYSSKKVLGVTSLDIVRANNFVAELKGLNVSETFVPVVGGHSGNTILPLLSHTTPKVKFSPEELVTLTRRIQNAGNEIIKAKDGSGSATLSMAYAAFKFLNNIIDALNGKRNITDYAYVATHNHMPVDYFASPILLGV